MKLKILVKLVEKILDATYSDDTPRADMYLPERLLAMSLVFLAGGTALCLLFALTRTLWMILAGIGGIVLGAMELLCWKNQSIRVISDEEFEYTTFLGNTHRYAFRDITSLRKNQDSLTLFVGQNKVHIESMAVISERLANLINQALAQTEEDKKACH